MKLFPLNPMSNLDRAKILLDIMTKNSQCNVSKVTERVQPKQPSKTLYLSQLYNISKNLLKGRK